MLLVAYMIVGDAFGTCIAKYTCKYLNQAGGSYESIKSSSSSSHVDRICHRSISNDNEKKHDINANYLHEQYHADDAQVVLKQALFVYA
jgi:hypothetical protein